jgi:hypothetical protein
MDRSPFLLPPLSPLRGDTTSKTPPLPAGWCFCFLSVNCLQIVDYFVSYKYNRPHLTFFVEMLQ